MADKEIYSSRIRAGELTYFFDVLEDGKGVRFLKLSESKKVGDKYEHSRIVVFEDKAEDFIEAMKDAVKRLATTKKKVPEKEDPAKAYSVEDIRTKHPQAYARWTEEDDAQLEKLFCEGKSSKELAVLFGRDAGAINSRIKKLELKEKYNR